MLRNVVIAVLVIACMVLSGLVLLLYDKVIHYKEVLRDREMTVSAYERVQHGLLSSCSCRYSKVEDALEENFEILPNTGDGGENAQIYSLVPRDEGQVRTHVGDFHGVRVESSRGEITEIDQVPPH